MLRRPLPVALLAGVLAALAFASSSKPSHGAVAAVIAAALVVLAATDLERRVIPNRIVLPATAIVLTARVAISPGHTLEWALAALGAGLLFLLPNLINGSAIGMGDVKLAVFLGAGLGAAVVPALTLAFISMLPFAVGTLVRGGAAARKATLPFAPFLAFGGLAILILPRLAGLVG